MDHPTAPEMTHSDLENSEQPPFSERQEVTFRRLLSQYECNLQLVCEHFPAIAEKLVAADLPCPIAVDESGQIIIHSPAFKGSLKHYREQARLYYETFANPATAAIFQHDGYDPRKQELRVKQDTAYYFYKPFEHKNLLRLQLQQQNQANKPRKKPLARTVLPIALVLGSGFSFHLNWMVEDFDIANLVIFETDLSHLNLALFFTDFPAIFDRMSEAGKTVLLIYSDSTENQHKEAIGRVASLIPPYMSQRVRIYYDSSNPQFVKQFIQGFRDDLWSFFHGWGFMDDEVLSVYYTGVNHHAKLPLLLQASNRKQDTPIFVIGSGPSLDGLIPWLIEHREEIIIMSCGSAVSALRKHNIKPDLHVEIERTTYTAEILLAMVEKSWLKDIPFIGTQLMSPEVYKIFKRKAGVLKRTDAGTMMLDPDNRYHHIYTNPTCTNGGVHIALSLGFNRVYLAGIDVGFVNKEKHHAKSSMYFSETTGNDEKSVQEVREIANKSMDTKMEVPGNFRKKVFSVSEFIQTRDVIAAAIKNFPHARVYNLNDGAKIPGAKPLRPASLRIPAKTADRKKIIDQVFECFSPQNHLNFPARQKELVQQIELLTQDFGNLLDSMRPKTTLDVLCALSGINSYLRTPALQKLPVIILVFGGVNIMANYCYKNTMFLNDDALAAQGFEQFKVHLLRALNILQKNIASIPAQQPA